MVYTIIVYDISVERQNEVREFLRKFLRHVQNSVFEGEITEGKLLYIVKRLKRMVTKEDHVVIYVLKGESCLKERIELGKEKENYFY